MELLKLRIRENRIQLKISGGEDGPDTILIASCTRTLLMQRLDKPKKGEKGLYKLQTSKYAKGAFVMYKCPCGKSPCWGDFGDGCIGPVFFEDNESLPSYNWEQIESGSVPYSALPQVFLIYLKSI